MELRSQAVLLLTPTNTRSFLQTSPAVTDRYGTAPVSLFRTLNNPISSEGQIPSLCPNLQWVTADCFHLRLFSLRSWSPSMQNSWRQRDFVKESLSSWFWWQTALNSRCSVSNASLSLARTGSNSFPTIKCPQSFSWSKITSLLSHHRVFALPFDSALLEYATGKYCKQLKDVFLLWDLSIYTFFLTNYQLLACS